MRTRLMARAAAGQCAGQLLVDHERLHVSLAVWADRGIESYLLPTERTFPLHRIGCRRKEREDDDAEPAEKETVEESHATLRSAYRDPDEDGHDPEDQHPDDADAAQPHDVEPTPWRLESRP